MTSKRLWMKSRPSRPTTDSPPRRHTLQRIALDEVAAKPSDHLCGLINTALDRRIEARGQALVSYFQAALTADRRAVFAALAHQVRPERIDAALAAVDGIDNREWVHKVAQQARLSMTHSRSCPTSEPIKAFQAQRSASRYPPPAVQWYPPPPV